MYQGNTASLQYLSGERVRFGGCAVFHPENDNLLYILGGNSMNGVTSSTFVMNLENSTFLDLEPMPVISRRHECIGFKLSNGNPVLIIIGGVTANEFLNSVYLYHINSNSFTSLADFPTKIARQSLALKSNFIYVFGGRNGSASEGSDLKAVYRLDTKEMEPWEKLNDMQTARRSVGVVPYN